MWKFAIVLFLVGAAITGYSLTLDAFGDEAHYWQQLASMTYFDD